MILKYIRFFRRWKYALRLYMVVEKANDNTEEESWNQEHY